ncbi:MAG: voltage-gated potassium channel [Saprospiraceae bacterium]|jgi:voltage-gated potassium channel
MLIGIGGYMNLENYTFINAFYMTVITISTVGFTEAQPLSDAGKIFSAIFIIFNIGIFAYSISVFTSFIIEGQLFKNMHINLIKDKISQLENHIIICGYGKHGKEIAENFMQHNIPFVIIDMNQEEIEEIQKNELKLLYLEGDATHDELLQEAGIMEARGLISALGNDTDNVFTVLTARQLNPKLHIISRARIPKTKKKLELAGADQVIMPEQIGGFYMASLISRPGAIEFFSFLVNQRISEVNMRAIKYEEFPEKHHGKSIAEMKFGDATGGNVIGFQKADGTYIVNPAPDVKIQKKCSFIVLGNLEQLKKVDAFLKG